MYNYFHLALLELTILLSYIMILLSNTVAMYNTRICEKQFLFF